MIKKTRSISQNLITFTTPYMGSLLVMQLMTTKVISTLGRTNASFFSSILFKARLFVHVYVYKSIDVDEA